jgi:hypothetical protein
MDSHIGDHVSPLIGLGLEVEEIAEGTQGPEVVPDIVDDPFFHFALFVGALGVAGPGDNSEGTEEVQEGLIEADERTYSLDDGCQHVIGNQFFWGALEETEGIEETAVKGFLSLGVGELQVEKTAVAFQDRQAGELARCIPIGDGSEVAPIHLALFPWKGFKADEGFSLFEVTSKGLQIVLEDGDASIKAQWSDPLKDHGGGGLCIDVQEPLDLLFERVQLAWLSYGDPLGIWVYKELSHGLWIDVEGGGDSLF